MVVETVEEDNVFSGVMGPLHHSEESSCSKERLQQLRQDLLQQEIKSYKTIPFCNIPPQNLLIHSNGGKNTNICFFNYLHKHINYYQSLQLWQLWSNFFYCGPS